jgi:hypothetical protein
MKVKYNVDVETVTGPIYGKIYDVISIELDWYRIIDESGEDYMYPPGLFEIVDPLPAPPVLTEEDIERGDGRKYMVIDEYAELLASGEPIKYLDDDEEYRDLHLMLPNEPIEEAMRKGWVGWKPDGSPLYIDKKAKPYAPSQINTEYCEVAEPAAAYS